LAVSKSDGSLCIVEPTEAGYSLAHDWPAHDYEAWIVAWNHWDSNVLFSGGDDCRFKIWDIRSGLSQPTFTSKRFDAGVTSIQSHPHIENLVAVGSYNNTVRLYDLRKSHVALAEASVGGGVWRIKWHPHVSRKQDMLVACMHDGFKVVKFSNISLGLEDSPVGEIGSSIEKRHDLHQSLAYGVDWAGCESGTKESIVASCSFYDHSLRLWKG